MAFPELMTTTCPSLLDVSKPTVYKFLRDFLSEMASIFTEQYLFLGGDEVDIGCFENSPNISAWMRQRGLNASTAQSFFWKTMAKDVLPALNKTVSVWLADGLQISPDDVPPGTMFNVYQDLKTAGAMLSSSSDAKVVVSMASQMWCKKVMLSRSVALPRLVNLESITIADLDSECSGYNQNAWGCAYSFQGPHGSWLEDPAWGQQQRERFLGGEAAVWGEGISVDNFDSFVWRSASAIAERLWTTEERLMCPPSHCPGISGADDGFGPGNGTRYWLTPGGPSGNYARFADQLCRMSRRGARTAAHRAHLAGILPV